jgi:hypothetical protein
LLFSVKFLFRLGQTGESEQPTESFKGKKLLDIAKDLLNPKKGNRTLKYLKREEFRKVCRDSCFNEN